MIKIDGSMGEGGRQILRTTISLATVLGTDVNIFNIRGNRPNPGLRPQHLHAIKTLSTISNATVNGLEINSTKVTYKPGTLKSQSLDIDMKTAGSITLLLQAVIQSVYRQNKAFSFNIIGGTDVPWSPTLNYFIYVALPLYKKFGIDIDMQLLKRGYYPQGGGKISFKISSNKNNSNFNLNNFSNNDTIVRITSSKINNDLVHIQQNVIEDNLRLHDIPYSIENVVENTFSDGMSILISKNSSDSYIGSDIVCNKKNINNVGLNVVRKYIDELKSGCSIDTNLSDMIVPLIVLSNSKFSFTSRSISEHFKTNLQVISKFLTFEYNIERKKPNFFEITIKP